MAKEIWFKHFKVIPVVTITDSDTGEEDGTVELGPQELKRGAMGAFSSDQWPLMMSSLREQFAQNPDLFTPIPPLIPNREQKRAAARAAKKPGRTTPSKTLEVM